MANDDLFLIDLADAVLDGRPLDWNAAAAQADPRQRELLLHLRAVESIASVSQGSVLPGAAQPTSLADDETSLPSQWGPLTIVSKIGRGSFGDVYRALDPRLHRPVALKLLRHGDHGDDAAESAVISEGRLMARVRHPNVVTVYGAERAEGRVGLWMEFVDGRTLEEELRDRGPLPPGEVARIGIDLCRALSAIHRAGLLHRDLKAQNILRDRDGRVLVTDFGAGIELSDDPDAVRELAGTPLYLAPEVLAGEAATVHSDIYSLGVLLFHLVTATYPVSGRSLAQVREAHVARRSSRVSDMRPDLDAAFRQAVERALTFDPRDRYESAETMEAALTQVAAAGASSGRAGALRRLALVAAATVLLILALAVAWLITGRSPEGFVLGRHAKVTADAGLEIDPAVSPDGRLVTYSSGVPGRMRVCVQTMAGGRPTRLTDQALGDERRPQWSPDGQLVLFTSGSVLATVPAAGGKAPTVVARATSIRSAVWSPDGRSILFIADSSLFRVPAAGGTPIAVRSLEDDAVSLSVSPDGSRIAYVTGNADFSIGTTQFANNGPSVVRIAALEGGPVIDLTDRLHVSVSPAWSVDGRSLFFVSDLEGYRDIYVADFDRGGVPSQPRRVTTGLDAHSLSLSARANTLAYSAFTRQANLWSVAINAHDVAASREAVRMTTGTEIVESYLASRDRRWLYFDSDRYGDSDVFRVRLDGGEPERLTSDPSDEFVNDLSSDGRELAFHAFRNGRREVFVMPAEGGRPQYVTDGLAARWSPDGSQLAVADVVITDAGATHRVLQRTADGVWGPPASLGQERCVTVDWKADGNGFVALCDGALRERAKDGAVTRTLYAPGDSAEPMPRYSSFPRGDTVYFKSYGADGYPSFWALPLAGGPPRLIFRLDDPERQASRKAFWTDGRRLYFTLEARQSDVWVVPIERRQP